MSYFNQPDHERIDRRNDDAKTLLLRLARGTTTEFDAPLMSRRNSRPSALHASDDALARIRDIICGREIPKPDAEPLVLNDLKVPLVWRGHYVAALLHAPTADVTTQLDHKGFEVIVFGADEATWPESLDCLARALGRAS
jgi:hypothetical protein